jgi:hypothetical protein
VWFVNATVPILRLQRGPDSVDVLWLAGCTVPTDLPPVGADLEVDFEPVDEDEEEDAPPPMASFRAFDPEDAGLILPSGAASADCILLTRLFRRSLSMARTTFSGEAVRAVRRFARRRHVYGAKYG